MYIGVHVTLFLLCLNNLWTQRKENPKWAYSWIAYIVILFIFGSMANALDMHIGQSIFVDNRNFPGGPAAYNTATFSAPVNVLCTAACTIGGWFQDALLVIPARQDGL